MRSRRLFASIAAAALAAFAAQRDARAVEHQYHLGGSVGYAGVVGSTLGASGLGGRIHLDYGVTDAFMLMSRVEVTAYPSVNVMVPSAAVGVGYVFDVLQFVPYAGAMAGVADLWSLDGRCGTVDPTTLVAATACHTPKVNLEIPFGVDYIVTRTVAIGLEGRYQLLVANGSTYNTLGVFARAEYIWGF
jgi:hypothetical protein